MSENNGLFNVAQRIKSQDGLNDDIKEILALIGQHIQHKYIVPLQQDFTCCSKDCIKEPTKEINLLKACKPFVNNNSNFDNIINIINTIRTLQKIENDYTVAVKAQNIDDSSIHKDGVYEIDESCLVGTKDTPINDNDRFTCILIILLFLVYLK